MNLTELEYLDAVRIMYQDAFTSKKDLTETGCPSELFVSFNRSAMDFSQDWGQLHLPGEYSYDGSLGYWVGKELIENGFTIGSVGIWNKTFGDQHERDGIEMNWCIGYIYDWGGGYYQYTCNVYNPSNSTCPQDVVYNWAFLVEVYLHQQMAPSTFHVKINGGKRYLVYYLKVWKEILWLYHLNSRFVLL